MIMHDALTDPGATEISIQQMGHLLDPQIDLKSFSITHSEELDLYDKH